MNAHSPLGVGERLMCFDVNAHSVRRTEPATSPNFRSGGCAEPETVGKLQHEGAVTLKRPALFERGGEQSLRRSAIFIMGVHRA